MAEAGARNRSPARLAAWLIIFALLLMLAGGMMLLREKKLAEPPSPATAQERAPRSQSAPARPLPVHKSELWVAVVAGLDRAPVLGARVTVDRDSGTDLADRTDPSGVVRFPALDRGQMVAVTVRHPRLEKQWAEVYLDADRVVHRVVLVGRGTLLGTVRTQEGAPLEGVSVRVRESVQWGRAKTDAAGRYRLDDLPRGEKLDAVFFLGGYEPRVEPIVVEEETILDVVLEPRPELQLGIRLEGADQVTARANVYLDDALVRTATISFRKGVSTFRCPYAGEEMARVSVALPAGGRAVGVGRVFERGGQAFVSMALGATRTLRFRFLHDGEAVGSAESVVTVHYATRGGIGSCRAGEDGEGRLVLGAGSDDAEDREFVFWNLLGVSAPVPIGSNEGTDSPITVDIGDHGALLEILPADGQDPADLRVEGLKTGRSRFLRASDEQSLRVRVPPGSYRILWRGLPMTSFSPPIGEGEIRRFDLAAGTKSGRIVGVTEPLKTIGIQYSDSGSLLRFGRITSDEDGHFLVKGLRPGRYLLRFETGDGLVVMRHADVRSGALTDLGRVDFESVAAVRFRVYTAAGDIEQREWLYVGGVPRNRYGRYLARPGADGTVRVAFGNSRLAYIGTETGFGILPVRSIETTGGVTIPAFKEAGTLRLPPDWSDAAQAILMLPVDDAVWFQDLPPVGPGSFALPAVSGRAFVAVTRQKGPLQWMALELHGEKEYRPVSPRTFRVSSSDLPEGAVHYTLYLHRLGEHKLSEMKWKMLPDPRPVPSDEFEIKVWPGTCLTLEFQGEGEKLWSAILDGDAHDTSVPTAVLQR